MVVVVGVCGGAQHALSQAAYCSAFLPDHAWLLCAAIQPSYLLASCATCDTRAMCVGVACRSKALSPPTWGGP